MPLLRDRCICLRKVEYSETSQILALFSRTYGIIRLIAKGAHRRTKAGSSKFDGGIDLLDVGEAVFSHAPSKELPPLTEWTLRDGHLQLRSTLRGIYLAQYAAELVVHLLEEHDPHPELFDRLIAFFDEAAGEEREAQFVSFQLTLLREAGFEPRITGCASCGRPTEELGPELFMSPMLGGRVCFDCAPAVPDRMGIDARLLRLLKRLPDTQTLPHLERTPKRSVEPPACRSRGTRNCTAPADAALHSAALPAGGAEPGDGTGLIALQRPLHSRPMRSWKHRSRFFGAIILSLALAHHAFADPRTFEFRGGHWPEISASTQPTTGPSMQAALASDEELHHIETLLSQKEYSYARKRAILWLLANRGSPFWDRGLFLEAQALFGYGNRIKAYFYLDELMDEYPESNLFTRALEMQYKIGEDFLNGYKRRLLGLPLLTAEEEGVEMMYRIQQRSPGSPLAERALLRTADYYFSDQQYDLAADTYAAYSRNYPRSEKLPRVRLREAFANLAQFRGLRFDATPVIDARAQLVRIMEQYPDEAQTESLNEVLQRIDETFARKLLGVADFYTRTHEPKAAVYTFRYLVNTYPDSPEAKTAQAKLREMPQWALNQPEPAGGAFGVPSSQPAGGTP